MNEKPVKFGLIGFGAWGGCHANAIDVTEGAEIAAIAVRSEESQATAREAYPNATVYGDYRELLANDELEAVDIVLPSYLHHEVAKAALEAGKHLLLEKPMTLTVADCRELVDLAQQNNVKLAVGHELRLSSLWARAKTLIDEGLIGDPQYVLVELSRKPIDTVLRVGVLISTVLETGFWKNRFTSSIWRDGISVVLANRRLFTPKQIHVSPNTPNFRTTLVQS